jgi:hypothetical protein
MPPQTPFFVFAMSGRREMKVGEISLVSTGPRLGELCHGPKVALHRVARLSRQTQRKSATGSWALDHLANTSFRFLCRFRPVRQAVGG